MSKSLEGNARYSARGVSSSKEEVHAAVSTLDPGLFPGAFCKITEDFLTRDAQKCNVIHADGSGTKSIIAYLHYRETGDASVFCGIAQDSLVMNIDDLLCIGATQDILISGTINRNAKTISQEILAALIQGTEDFLRNLRSLGINISSGGGETADVGDLTGTVIVDSCATAVMERGKVLDGSGITPGLSIIGLSSSGKASYESKENSGIGSNGLTSARHDLLAAYYGEKYPETVDSKVDKRLIYSGPYRLEDPLPNSNFSVGEALLSPTRTYAPVIDDLLKNFPGVIRGIVHCSGGGQTKCLRFGKNVHFVKDRFLPIPAIFTTIQKVSGTSWEEMFQVYNMGHRMELYCEPSDASSLQEEIEKHGIESEIVGHTEKSQEPEGRNHLTIKHEDKRLTYKAPLT